MIFYFTGTGNSLHIAKQLQDEIFSIPQVLKEDNLQFTSEKIGIVAPIFCHELPPIVKEFLKKATFNTNYFYFILSYGGGNGGAPVHTKKLCDEYGISINYLNLIEMVDNWLPMFDMEEQIKMERKVDESLSKIISDLKENKNFIYPVTEEDLQMHETFIKEMSELPEGYWQHLFTVNDKCNGCGICEKLCPTKSINLVDKKANHIAGNCQNCLACIQNCPQNAIELTIPEKNKNARYRNEFISLEELIKANCQI